MAKDKNTHAKRRREMLKKQKAETKLERRQKRKALSSGTMSAGIVPNNHDRTQE